MGGGKGGSQTTEQVQRVEIDPRLEQLGVAVGTGALKTAALPFRMPRGVQIAAFTPQQQAAFQGASAASSALGLPSAGTAAMPEPEVNSMGIAGYDPSYLYDEMMSETFTDEDIAAREDISSYYRSQADKVNSMGGLKRGSSISSGGGGKK